MTTEAGKRLAESLRRLLPNMPLTWEGIDDRIVSIEAEAVAAERADCGRKVRDVATAIRDTEIPQAVAAERARIAAAVRALEDSAHELYGEEMLAAVLRIIEGTL